MKNKAIMRLVLIPIVEIVVTLLLYFADDCKASTAIGSAVIFVIFDVIFALRVYHKLRVHIIYRQASSAAHNKDYDKVNSILDRYIERFPVLQFLKITILYLTGNIEQYISQYAQVDVDSLDLDESYAYMLYDYYCNKMAYDLMVGNSINVGGVDSLTLTPEQSTRLLYGDTIKAIARQDYQLARQCLDSYYEYLATSGQHIESFAITYMATVVAHELREDTQQLMNQLQQLAKNAFTQGVFDKLHQQYDTSATNRLA